MMRHAQNALLLCLLSLAGFSPVAKANGENWGIGFVAGVRPSLSLQHRFTRTEATHYTLHYTDTSLIAGFDFQKFLGTRMGILPHSVEAYSGFGISGHAQKESETKEEFHARIPVGLQWTDAFLRMSAFLEIAARMGPVPKTSLEGEAGCGLRTVF